tara:strand:+ start:788 stop:898 length:111 start_codon:yes stop_codon:yes gene_type:complete
MRTCPNKSQKITSKNKYFIQEEEEEKNGKNEYKKEI